jgi:hypothetical protein
VTPDRYEWPALLNTVMNMGGSQNAGDSLLTEELLVPEQGLCSFELGS